MQSSAYTNAMFKANDTLAFQSFPLFIHPKSYHSML